MVRILPNIPKIKAHWCHRCSEYPEWLEVPMSDGTVVKYYPQVEQPAFIRSLNLIRNMTDPRTGYERKGPVDGRNIRSVAQIEKP